MAVEGDLPRIVEIYNASIPGMLATAELKTVTVDDKRAWFQAHGGCRPLWVKEEKGVIQGWLSLSDFHPRCAYEITAEVGVYMDPQFLRRGVARELLGLAIQRSPSLGIEALVALIFGHNIPSVTLFKAQGFERWGHLPSVANMAGTRRDLEIYGRSIK